MDNTVHWKQNLAPTTDENGKRVATQSPNAKVLAGHAKAQAAPSNMRAANAGGIDVKDRYDTLQARDAESAAIRNAPVNRNSSRGEDTAQKNFLSSRLQSNYNSQRADQVANMSVEEYKAYGASKQASQAAAAPAAKGSSQKQGRGLERDYNKGTNKKNSRFG